VQQLANTTPIQVNKLLAEHTDIPASILDRALSDAQQLILILKSRTPNILFTSSILYIYSTIDGLHTLFINIFDHFYLLLQ